MTLRDFIKRTTHAAFLRSDHFAEAVTYYPGGNLGAGVSVLAIIDRDGIDPLGIDEADSLAEEIDLVISNDASEGIETILEKKDLVDVPEEPGSSSTIRVLVTAIAGRDLGAWHLRATR